LIIPEPVSSPVVFSPLALSLPHQALQHCLFYCIFIFVQLIERKLSLDERERHRGRTLTGDKSPSDLVRNQSEKKEKMIYTHGFHVKRRSLIEYSDVPVTRKIEIIC
jgi:hypothetical protein